MAVAGYKTTVKKGGTSTAFASEPMGNVSGNIFLITDASKRVWDRSVVPDFYEDSVLIESSDIVSIDYLFGKVTFATAKTGTIYVDGNYLPILAIGGAHGYSMSITRVMLDDTDYETAQDSGARSRMSGLLDVSVTVDRFDPLDKSMYTILSSGLPVLLEIRPGGAGEYARGWFLLESANPAGNLEGLENEALSFMLDGDAKASFSWGS